VAQLPQHPQRHLVKDKVVLVGDAKATAHFSIGSGTKLAMEDAIALYESLRAEGGVKAALARYDSQRREGVERTQHAADVSLAWFENMRRYWNMDPQQFAFGLMSRSKQITYENVRLRDPSFLDAVSRWFADKFIPPDSRSRCATRRRRCSRRSRCAHARGEPRGGLAMDQYMAAEGVPNEWHLVHWAAAR